MNSTNDNTRWRLDGKTAIATGATKGIGRATAADLLDSGAKVLIVARTPPDKIAAPEEVSGTIAFLCLPAASYITGQCVATDGGFLAKGF